MKRSALSLIVLLSMLSMFAGVVPAHAASTIGEFEIDGNTPDDTGPGDPLDWETAIEPAVDGRIDFTDAVGGNDDIFSGGSKELQPGGWVCAIGSAPAKDDIATGSIAFRVINGDQWVYVNFTRASAKGDAHMDYEFNQSNEPNPSCPELPVRTPGDVLITFDTETGKQKKDLFVRAFTWQGDASKGTFVEQGVGQQGVTWDAAASADNLFGEAALNLTDTIGDIDCDDFASAFMKTRASTSISAALKDRTRAEPVDVGRCPDSDLHKAVRNVSDSGSFGTSTTAVPGDVIEYQLTAHNHGNAEATNVVITEEVPERSTVTACGGDAQPDGGCPTGAGPGTIMTWTIASIPAGGEAVVTFRVQLDATFPAGETVISNIATITSDDEEPEDSNETTVTVVAAAAFERDKEVSTDGGETFHDGASVTFGDSVIYRITVTNDGSAPGSTTVVDDYDADHITVSDINPAPDSHDTVNGVITWNTGTIEPGASTVFTYTGTFDKPFSPGDDECEAGGFLVRNTVTVAGETDSVDVCVAAEPAFEDDKQVSTDGGATFSDGPVTVDFGDSVIYQIEVENVGSGPGSTTVHDDFDEDRVSVSNISNGGEVVTIDGNQVIEWTPSDIGEIAAGDSVFLTYTATFDKAFEEGDPECPTGGFLVENLATVEGDSDSVDVCVNAEPDLQPDKKVSTDGGTTFTDGPVTVQSGDSVIYQITVTNNGDAPGSRTVSDDYEADHVTVSNITPPPTTHDEVAGIITWTSDVLDPGASQTFSYTATFDKPFTDADPECPTGAFLVQNLVTVEDDQDSVDVCVEAEPDLQLEKSAELTGSSPGDTITYQIDYRNDGTAAATGVVIHEDMPEGTTFSSCSDSCTENGDPVTSVDWNIGTIPAGGSGSVTLTVTIADNVGCEVCNTATATATNQAGEIRSTPDPLCIDTTPGPRPDLANASGSALGAHIEVPPLLNEDISQAASSQSGVGSDGASDELLSLAALGIPEDVLAASVLSTTSTSTVTADPAQARALSTATAVGVNVLDGIVTADLVRGVADATATGDSVNASTVGTTFKNLTVDPDGTGGEEPMLVNDVNPNTTITLAPDIFGAGARVVLFEESKTTSAPAIGQLSGGTYAADASVNAIHVVIPLLGIDIIVSQAIAHADFPQTTLCEEVAGQRVSGHAYTASLTLDPDLVGLLEGYVEIPSTGGADHQHVDHLKIPQSGATVNLGASDTDAVGSIADPSVSTAHAYAAVASVCLLKEAGACTIGADAVRSEASSTADALGASSSDAGTTFLNLVIGGTPIGGVAPANTLIEVPGVGFVILNEQFCTSPTGGLAPSCADPMATGLTVRAIRLVITADIIGGPPPGAELIVAEAHSDAFYNAIP